jgi:hypothetical protein
MKHKKTESGIILPLNKEEERKEKRPNSQWININGRGFFAGPVKC